MIPDAVQVNGRAVPLLRLSDLAATVEALVALGFVPEAAERLLDFALVRGLVDRLQADTEAMRDEADPAVWHRFCDVSVLVLALVAACSEEPYRGRHGMVRMLVEQLAPAWERFGSEFGPTMAA